MSDVRHRDDLVDDSAWIADSATVRGDVRVGKEASIWFGAVIRGDVEPITIGDRSNVQDNCVLHADPGFPCTIGRNVTIGHAAVVHGATVDDGALIGIRAVVLNGAKIGSGAIVGAGAVVTEGMEVPPGHLAVGIPAKVIRELTPENIAMAERGAGRYVEASRRYRELDLES